MEICRNTTNLLLLDIYIIFNFFIPQSIPLWVCVHVCVYICMIFTSLGHPLRKGMGRSKDRHILKAFVEGAKLFQEKFSKWYTRVLDFLGNTGLKHLIVLNLPFIGYSLS